MSEYSFYFIIILIPCGSIKMEVIYISRKYSTRYYDRQWRCAPDTGQRILGHYKFIHIHKDTVKCDIEIHTEIEFGIFVKASVPLLHSYCIVGCSYNIVKLQATPLSYLTARYSWPKSQVFFRNILQCTNYSLTVWIYYKLK